VGGEEPLEADAPARDGAAVNGQWQTQWAAVADRFGVDMEQVRRDHLISHVLSAISARVPSADVVFFGGTALSRTYLTASRLSEDLDLIAVAPRSQVSAALQTAIRTGLARSHGAMTWRPALTATTGSQPATRLSVRADQALDVVRTAWLTAAEGTART
jgi:hypothetical protein